MNSWNLLLRKKRIFHEEHLLGRPSAEVAVVVVTSARCEATEGTSEGRASGRLGGRAGGAEDGASGPAAAYSAATRPLIRQLLSPRRVELARMGGRVAVPGRWSLHGWLVRCPPPPRGVRARVAYVSSRKEAGSPSPLGRS